MGGLRIPNSVTWQYSGPARRAPNTARIAMFKKEPMVTTREEFRVYRCMREREKRKRRRRRREEEEEKMMMTRLLS